MHQTQRIVTTCTRDCPNTCGLIATIDNGRLISLSGSPLHPLTRGLACHKTSSYIERVYSEERITYPLKRSGGKWERVTWDAALDDITRKLIQIKQQDGPEAVLYYQGYGERTALKLLNRYFFNLYGGVTTLRGSLCGGTGQAAQNLDFGERISHDPLDHYNSHNMILWGRNPVSTNISLVPIIQNIKDRGGKVVVIDPVKTRSAKLSTHHIAPAPGQDFYLAIAVAKLIMASSKEDRTFIVNYSCGFADFKKIMEQFNIDELCRRADVLLSDAELLASLLVEDRPTSILLGWGLHRHVNAHFAIRAIDAMSALSGNIGVAGGGVSQGFEEYGPYDQQYWGDQLNSSRRTLLMPELARDLNRTVNPKIRMAMISAGNPVCMAPDSAAVAAALKQLECVVYCGHFLDDTADVADYFLPATTFLEETDVMASYGHNYVGPVNRAIEPIGECKSDFEVFTGLAKRFDFAERFCLDIETWLDRICAPIIQAGCSLEQLRQGPFRMPQPLAPYLDRAFSTESGRFEFLRSGPEEEVSTKDLCYPYRLLSIAPHDHICSERSLSEHAALPEVRMNDQQAVELGLKNGQMVYVESVQGGLTMCLKVDSGVRRDCLVCERGGWIKAGHGVNQLCLPLTSTIGNGTSYYSTQVNIRPALICPQV